MARNAVEILINLQKKGEGGAEAERELSGVEKAAKAAGAALISYVSFESIKAAAELARLGAESIRTRSAFTAISGGADEASARLAAMERATRGALSEQQAMASANQLMQMGLANNADELEKVARMAVRLGTAMGRDAGQSLEEFSLLLANQSIPRLDTFGISAGKVRTRIAELQAETPGLTREMAFMQATFEEGEVSLGRLGEAVEDELLAFERLEATTANLRAELGERLAPTAATVASAMELLLTWNERVEEAQAAHAEEVAGTAGTYEEYVAELTRAAGVAGMVINAEGDLVRAYQVHGRAVEEVVQANYALSEASWETARMVEQGSVAADGWMVRMRGQTAAAAAAQEGLDGLSASAGKVAKSFGEMVFDNETLWNMALASGASIEALGSLAQHLGIATDAEIQNTLAGYGLVEAFGAGRVSAEQLEEGFDSLAMAQIRNSVAAAGLEQEVRGVTQGVHAIASVDEKAAKAALTLAQAEQEAMNAQQAHRETTGSLSEGLIELEESVATVTYSADDLRMNIDQVTEAEIAARRETARMGLAMERAREKADRLRRDALLLNDGLQGVEGTTRSLSGSFEIMGDDLGEVAHAAQYTADALNSIPTEIVIDIYYNEHGGPGGGGTQQFDFPVADVAGVEVGGFGGVGGGGRANVRTDNRRYNNNQRVSIVNNVVDPLAAAMVLEEQRRKIMRGLEREF